MITCIPPPQLTPTRTRTRSHHIQVINSRPRWKHRKRRTANNARHLARFLFFVFLPVFHRGEWGVSLARRVLVFLPLTRAVPHPSWPFSPVFFKSRAAKVRKLARGRTQEKCVDARKCTTAWKFINGCKLRLVELFIIASRICISLSSLNLRATTPSSSVNRIKNFRLSLL